MYADPSRRKKLNPVSLGAALSVNALIILGMMYAAPQMMPREFVDRWLPTKNYPEPPPPPPADPVKSKEPTKPVTNTQIYTPKQLIETPSQPNSLNTVTEPPINPPPIPADPGPITRPAAEPIQPPAPFIGASIDPRFANLLQPEYPASEIRAEREGKVTVRVRIGPDGRVKEVQQVSATSPAFFEATKRQALGRWRFRPATRGGVAEESWTTKTVTFVLNGG